jgi:murein DD-endopeptidase MepM/ murein hydrolase activator NlpD
MRGERPLLQRLQQAVSTGLLWLIRTTVLLLALYGAWHLGIRISKGGVSGSSSQGGRSSDTSDPGGAGGGTDLADPVEELREAPKKASGDDGDSQRPVARRPALQPEPAPPKPPAVSTSRPQQSPSEMSAVAELRRRKLTIPVGGVTASELRDDFTDARSGGRTHEALDILAPRDHPVVAVEEGRIAKLFESKLGGLTIYQFGSQEHFSYYYAHLERYARGLKQGDQVERGQVIGYVGTSGNAPPDTPHLHFAIYLLPAGKEWWKGDAINPYPVFVDE